jgi:hypothetical protein
MSRWILAAALLGLLGCGCQHNTVPDGPDPDVITDPDVDGVDLPPDILDPDVWVDTGPPDTLEVIDDEVPEPLCPPEGPLGQACRGDVDCTGGLTCLVETSQDFDGETYRVWAGGYCVDTSWAAGCSPDDPEACPEGARCVQMGTVTCEDRWACLDACTPADPRGVPFTFNACCRDGYRCDPGLSVCVPGCSNDRQCCEAWSDADGDTLRGSGEVALDSDCSRTCGTESNACEGPGNGPYAAACVFDADCPDGAMCLREGCVADFGGPFPGGLCMRERCDLLGVTCDIGSGGCVDLGAAGDPRPVCLAACVTGHAPGDPASACRDGQACVPACTGDWVGGPPLTGEDGWCWPANPGTAGPETMYENCSTDLECHSPLGLGSCLPTAGERRCSAPCNGSLARDHDLCGPPLTSGDPPTGACWACRCRKVCNDPASLLVTDACAAAGALACYDVAGLAGEIAYSSDAAAPAGLCLPACAGSDDCLALWGVPLACDPTTGICS